MRKASCVVLALAVFFAGCAGREANPIPAYLPGDNKRSCEVLVAETAQLQADMQRLLPKTNKGVTNTLWAAAGVFLIVPFFFIDLKDAEKIEFEAMRTRHNRLLLICADKGCDMIGVRAERIPSAEEAKKMAKGNISSVKEVVKCNICGTLGGNDSQWRMIDGKLLCLDCYKKQEAKTISQKQYEEDQRYLAKQKE